MVESRQEVEQDAVVKNPLVNKKKVSKKIFIKLVISFFLLAFVMILMGAVAYIEATM